MGRVRSRTTRTRKSKQRGRFSFASGSFEPRSAERTLVVPPTLGRYNDTGELALRCGHCEAPIERLNAGEHTLCDVCGRRIKVPNSITVYCLRCGRPHHIRPTELSVDRLCAACGFSLLRDEPALSPPVGNRAVRWRRPPPAGKMASALWMILGIVAVILACLFALRQL